MTTEKRFWVKANYGHWSVMDTKDGKMVVGYSKKEYAELTAYGLNKIKGEEKILKMKEILKTEKGYGYYVRRYKE